MHLYLIAQTRQPRCNVDYLRLPCTPFEIEALNAHRISCGGIRSDSEPVPEHIMKGSMRDCARARMRDVRKTRPDARSVWHDC